MSFRLRIARKARLSGEMSLSKLSHGEMFYILPLFIALDNKSDYSISPKGLCYMVCVPNIRNTQIVLQVNSKTRRCLGNQEEFCKVQRREKSSLTNFELLYLQGGGWTLVVSISSENNDHLQRNANNCLNSILCVPLADNNNITGRKLSDEDIGKLAHTEGKARLQGKEMIMALNMEETN